MTPVGSQGPEGSPDYQRVVNWDASQFVSLIGGSKTGVQSFGPFNVSRYGYLAGTVGGDIVGNTEDFLLFLEWSTEENFNHVCGFKRIWVPANQRAKMQLRTPNMGPWLKCGVKPATEATAFKPSLLLFPTTRYSPIEVIPANGVIANETVEVEPGGGQVDIPPETMHSGAMRIKVFGEVSGWTVWMQALVGHNTWAVCEVISGGLNENKTVTTIAPSTGWKFTAINSSGAKGKISVTAWPSFSGSS